MSLTYRLLTGDCRASMSAMEAESVHCCITSPPYWGLRDYGHAGQLGLERTPEEYVAKMVEVFREVRHVLRDDGTLWLNLGDSYAGSWGAQSRGNTTGEPTSTLGGGSPLSARQIAAHPHREAGTGSLKRTPGLKAKDLVGIPWRVAFALQADGWYLRSEIIWAKPNPMPESVTDRPTKTHEQVFLLAKSERYYYDAKAIAEPSIYAGEVKDYTGDQKNNSTDPELQRTRIKDRKLVVTDTPNKRTVWTVPTHPFPEAHFATFPEKLIEPCVLAGSPLGGIVLDPFSGAGTTGVVALKASRHYVGCELNPEYVAMSRRRLENVSPLLAKEIA